MSAGALSTAVRQTPVLPETLLNVEGVCKIYGGEEKLAAAAVMSGATRGELVQRFNSFSAVADASFQVSAGEIFVIMGLSGSGKSTLLRCINRLIEPTSGRVQFIGEDVLAASAARLRDLRLSKISMVFQHFALLPHKSVLDNVAFGLKMRGAGRRERNEVARQFIERVGLVGWEDRFPGDLSGGMKQRVGLARSLAVDPDLLLMDEAFSALDPIIRREMQLELKQLQMAMNKTVVFITHDIHEALLLGDRIAMMKDGRIVQNGSPADLILRPTNDFVGDFTRDADRSRLLKARDIMEACVGAEPIHLDGDPATSIFIDSNGKARGYTIGSGADKEMLRTDFQRASAADPLGTILKLCTSSAPIVVTDLNGTTLGAFARNRLLEVLAL
jgi:glycine betaine/proline transport system ATP-binding protein